MLHLSTCFGRSDGTVVPLGHPRDTGVNNPSGYTLNYNEFIVYDPRQVKIRYVVQVQFNFL
jgi:poly [ADP-ribose] polymerase